MYDARHNSPSEFSNDDGDEEDEDEDESDSDSDSIPEYPDYQGYILLVPRHLSPGPLYSCDYQEGTEELNSRDASWDANAAVRAIYGCGEVCAAFWSSVAEEAAKGTENS